MICFTKMTLVALRVTQGAKRPHRGRLGGFLEVQETAHWDWGWALALGMQKNGRILELSPLQVESTGLAGSWSALYRGRNGLESRGIKAPDLSLSRLSKETCQVHCWRERSQIRARPRAVAEGGEEGFKWHCEGWGISRKR